MTLYISTLQYFTPRSPPPPPITTQKIYNLLKDDLYPSKVKRHFDVVSSQRQTLGTIY